MLRYNLIYSLLLTIARMDSGKAEESEVIEVYCHVYVSVVFQIRREVGPALHSVMPRTSTQSFCSLGDNEKVILFLVVVCCSG